jgi:hypothetical protein
MDRWFDIGDICVVERQQKRRIARNEAKEMMNMEDKK